MEQHSTKDRFDMDKYSYLDLILNCTDYEYDREAPEAFKEELYNILLTKLTEEEISEVAILVDRIAHESSGCVLRAVSEMECVKVVLSK